MIAIGISLMTLTCMSAVLDMYIRLSNKAKTIFGGIFLLGAALFMAGVIVWAWRVLP